MHNRYFTDILKMCMKKLMLKNYFLTNLQGFDLHFVGVYCKPCLQPISCFFILFILFICYNISRIKHMNDRTDSNSQG